MLGLCSFSCSSYKARGCGNGAQRQLNWFSRRCAQEHHFLQTISESPKDSQFLNPKASLSSWLISCVWASAHDSFTQSLMGKGENLLNVWCIWKVLPQIYKETSQKIQVEAKGMSSPEQQNQSRWGLSRQPMKQSHAACAWGKGKGSQSWDWMTVVWSKQCVSDLLYSALNRFIFLSLCIAVTFAGFLEITFQSALSALSNYSEGLLLVDRTEVLHKIFNSCPAEFSNAPSAGPNMRAWSQQLSHTK